MSTTASPGDRGRFPPGYVFAGRYRIVTRIGRGGMGEVWRADDLVLKAPVALKLVDSADRETRERILNEVRLARQVTNAAVCRVFDVGEADGEIFYSMELVEGEDLATLMRRVGRLPNEKVVAIGRQLCAGLAAAHARGVLHRDLKPANVLIDQNGSVKITDFGIAVATSGEAARMLAGTPRYMAPEQLTPGTPLSERTDLFALGVVLYELLAGRHPFEGHPNGSITPPKPSEIVPGVNPRVERIVLKTLAAAPERRPSGAAAVEAALVASAARHEGRAWAAGAALAAAVALIAVLSSFLAGRRGEALTSQDTIVLADFVNTTGEPVFDGALKVALAVALEQSPFLKIFPDERAGETLRLMQRAADEPITRAIAREIARRERLKALIAGSISNLGSQYVIAVEAIDAETGDIMAREQREAASKELVLTSLGAAASSLREKLGESLASIQRFDAPLPRATTSSLEALHAYALALDQGRMTPRVEAIPHLRRAIELDPTFALAQAQLSGVYANTGRSAEAPEFSRRAFELRDRVSERERFFISWRYYIDALQAWDEALQLATSWTATYPREAFAFNSLGLASGAFGQHTQAVDAFREAIRLDPKFVPPYGNLAGSLIALNRFADARTTLAEAAARGVDFMSLRRMAYLLAFLENDSAGMARELDLVRTMPQSVWGAVWEGRTAIFGGRFRVAEDLLQRAVQSALADGFRELGAQWTMEDAEARAIAGDCEAAGREVSRGLELGRDNFTLERASRTLALCGERRRSQTLTAELASRFAPATLTTRLLIPIATAALAVTEREPAAALAALENVEPYEGAPAGELWPAYLRAQAHLQLKNGRAAGEAFQWILDRRGLAPTSPLYPLAHLGLARASVLTADTARARREYEEFLGLWKGADQPIRPLGEAREEYARLK
jgi:eukaryotic-like serine/threonine-protein kinase